MQGLVPSKCVLAAKEHNARSSSKQSHERQRKLGMVYSEVTYILHAKNHIQHPIPCQIWCRRPVKISMNCQTCQINFEFTPQIFQREGVGKLAVHGLTSHEHISLDDAPAQRPYLHEFGDQSNTETLILQTADPIELHCEKYAQTGYILVGCQYGKDCVVVSHTRGAKTHLHSKNIFISTLHVLAR